MLTVIAAKEKNTIFREENHDFVVRNMSCAMRLVGLEPSARPSGSATGRSSPLTRPQSPLLQKVVPAVHGGHAEEPSSQTARMEARVDGSPARVQAPARGHGREDGPPSLPAAPPLERDLSGCRRAPQCGTLGPGAARPPAILCC